jgi:putative tryptophan/tyrosine transport system substrate-binding protein
MARKTIIVVWLVALALAPFRLAEAQQAKKVHRIGYLTSNTSSAELPRFDAFRQALRELGHVEGQNITIEYRYAEGRFDRLPGFAAELVGLKVDVLVGVTTNAVVAAKNATRTIPIVFFGGGDPAVAGLVDSLARPGGNITGFTSIGAVLAGKRLELLKETVPNLSRVAVLWDPQDPSAAQQWKESQLPARELGLQLHSMEIGSADDFESAFKEAIKARSAGLAVTSGALSLSNQKRVAELATKNRLPAIYSRKDFVTSGGLMSYGDDRTEPYRRAAIFVDKILKGTKPADIPVEQPTKFELTINLKAAKQIGLTIPPNVLARADKVIK